MVFKLIEFAYDANGSVTKITLPEGGTITYVYDSDGRLTQENHEDKNGEISNCITYAHAHAGRRLTVTAPD